MGHGAVLVDIGHPAHVHVFRNALRLMQASGLDVVVTARRKEVSLALLEAYGIPYEEIGSHWTGVWQKAVHSFERASGIARSMKVHNVRAAMGVHNPYLAAAGVLTGARTAVLVDSEPVRYDRWLTYRLANYLLTPRGFRNDLGPRQVRFDGFKELAYLHPLYFTPDAEVLRRLDLSPGDRYFLVRFVAWAAEHDIGQRGLSLDQKKRLVKALAQHGRVLITSETPLPSDLAAYRLSISPDQIHHVLHFASLLVSESQTMTTEAAVLGTPVVWTNSLVGSMSNFVELEKRYGLIQAVRDGEEAITIAEASASDKGLKGEALRRAQSLVESKIDVTAYLVRVFRSLIEGHRPPEGLKVPDS